MKRILHLSVIILLMTSCMSEEKQNAAAKVAELWGAQKASVGSSSLANTQSGTSKALTLTLENLTGVNADYPHENITSVSAYTFIENLEPKEYEGYNSVKIIVKNNTAAFEESYKISDLLSAKEIFKAVDVFSKKIMSGNLDGFESLFDKQRIPDSSIVQIKRVILSNDSLNGRPDKTSVVRLDFDHVKETNEPVMVTYVGMEGKTSYAMYKLILKTADKKIIYFGLNDDLANKQSQ